MPNLSTDIAAEYDRRIAALTPAERVARSAALFELGRKQIERRVETREGPLSQTRLRWLVALELYGREPQARELIEQRLRDVPR